MENPPSLPAFFSSVCVYPNQTTNSGRMGGYPSYLAHRTRLLLAWACFFICEGQRSRLWRKQATVLESKSILLFLAFGYLVDLQNGFSSIESTCLGWLWRAPGPLDVLWVCQLTHSPTSWGPQELSGSSPKRRRAEDKDEGIGSPDIWEDEKAEDLRREMIELRQQLDKERSVRMMLEEQVRQRPLLASVIPRHRGWSLVFFCSVPPSKYFFTKEPTLCLA